MSEGWRPNRWPIALQLAVAFALVMALALGGGGMLLVSQVSGRMLADRSRTLMAQAGAAANLAGEFREGAPLALALYRFHQQTGVRPLVADMEGRVVSDSRQPSPLAGQRLTHPEVTAAMAGLQATGIRWLQTGGWVMYGAVPVWQEQRQTGVVLVSADISGIDLAVRDLQRQLLVIALVAGTLSAAVGALLARYLSRPLVRLNRAVGLVARGLLDTRVEPGGNREMLEVGHNFNKMASELRRLDRQQRAFVADASHELRTPIASVRALADALLADKTGEIDRYKEYLGDIARECDRAGRLVDHLLELARLDMRREAPIPEGTRLEPVDLREIATELVHSLEPLARERQVLLELHAPERVDTRADRRLVETVLGNLIENGLKYTLPGGTIHVSLRTEGGMAQFAVRDNGVGIAPEHVAHIFERFFRVDKARTRATGGAGLGLSIAAEAAALLNGRITVESEPHKGSCFTFAMPL